MVEKISPTAQEIIQAYKHLIIRGIEVRTPYYRNVKRIRAELRSLTGKGTPEEIIEETIIFAQLRGVKFQCLSSEELKQFMESQGVGVDCSAFVAHIFDYWLKKNKHKSLYSVIKFPPTNLYRRFLQRLRPIENIGVEILTGPLNSEKVNFNEMKPGYLIRLKGIKQGHHIAIITEVQRDDKTKTLTSFKYAHSTQHFGKDNGIREGEIIITDNTKPLEFQNWTELDEKGDCPTKLQYLTKIEDNGVVKPKFFEELV
jgi:hypothetical protein